MAQQLGLIDQARLTVGAVLYGLSALAERYPLYLCAGVGLVVLSAAWLSGRRASARHLADKVPQGAAWLTSSFAVGGPLVGLWLLDRLSRLTAGASLEARLLEYFSPAVVLRNAAAAAASSAAAALPPGAAASLPPPPAAPDLQVLVSYPAPAALCLFGAVAIAAYQALYARGGVGVTPRDVEAGGWMRIAGHWGLRGAERRFGLWAAPLAKGIFGVCNFAVAAAAAGHLPPVLWIGCAILTHGLMKAAEDALAPASAEEPKKDEAGAPEAKAPSAEILPGAETLEGIVARALGAAVCLASEQEASRETVAKSEAAGGAVIGEILAGLGVAGLYTHQAQALEAFLGGANVLLCTPPGSGRAALRDALAMHAVLSEGASVLFLCRDAEEAEAAWQAFRARAGKAHWRWSVPAAVLSGREQLDLDRVQPSIVFAGWEELHSRLLADASRFDFFLRSLRMVALPHVERYQGPSSDHLGFLLARLRRVSVVAAGPAALAGGAVGPRLFLTADPIGPDVARLAERIAAEPVTVIGEESDGAPCAAIRHLWLTRPDGSVPTAQEVAAELRRARIPWCAVGLGSELGAEASAIDPRRARAVMVRADAPAVAGLPLRLRHYGSASGVGSAVVALWLGGDDPLSRLLPGAAGRPLVERLRPPRLVAGAGSGRVALDHATCALADAAWPLPQLEAVFGAEPARAALEALRAEGPVLLEERPRLDADAAEVGRDQIARAPKARPHRRVTLGVVGRALRIEDRSTGRVLHAVPAERALAAGHPERILVADWRRFRVLPVSEQRRRDDGVLWAEADPNAEATVPLRRLELEPAAERRRADLGAPAGADRRAPGRRAFAGREFSLNWPRVRIRERIEGFRSIRGREVVDAGTFPAAIEGAHEGRAAVLGFPEGWTVTPAGLHALAHLFRAVLPAVLRAGADDLDVVDLTWAGEPAIALVDLHPGGGGFAEAVTLDALRSLATLSLAVVRGCNCRDPGGCPNCVRGPDCRSARSGGERAPSRREAEALLCDLLDPKLHQSGDRVEYGSGSGSQVA